MYIPTYLVWCTSLGYSPVWRCNGVKLTWLVKYLWLTHCWDYSNIILSLCHFHYNVNGHVAWSDRPMVAVQ